MTCVSCDAEKAFPFLKRSNVDLSRDSEFRLTRRQPPENKTTTGSADGSMYHPYLDVEGDDGPGHLRVTMSVTNPCDLWKSNLVTSQIQASELRQIIMDKMSSHLKFDFDVKDLTASKIKRLIRLLDMYFYNNTLVRSVKARGVRLLCETCHFYKPDEHQPTKQPCAKTVAVFRQGETVPEMVSVKFNLNRYGTSAKFRNTNGIDVRNKLEAVVITALHELVHVIIYVWCSEKQGHGKIFKHINQKVNGHDFDSFTFYDRR